MHDFNSELMKIKVMKDEYDKELVKEEMVKKHTTNPKEIAHSVV